MEMEDVIIRALLDHGYTTDDILLYDNAEYISTFNPLTDDKNSKSCIIFKDSGILKMLNGTFERNGKVFTTMTPTEWLRSIQKMKYYIAYICYKNQFSKKDLTEYYKYLISRLKKNRDFACDFINFNTFRCSKITSHGNIIIFKMFSIRLGLLAASIAKQTVTALRH